MARQPQSESSAPFKETSVGLELSGDVNEEQWIEFGRDLGRRTRVLNFALGDWLNYAQQAFDGGKETDDRYTKAEEVTGLARTTLHNYASVSTRVPSSRRREELTFGHHDAVAS